MHFSFFFRILISVFMLWVPFLWGQKEDTQKPHVLIKTNRGDLLIQLNPERAPITVKNFLHYVDNQFYHNTVFHRVKEDFMVQGGGFTQKNGILTQKKTLAPIKNESQGGLKNLAGTIAMARKGHPDSATAQFFLNTATNSFLDYDQGGGGYTVFGRIIEGLNVLKKIEEEQTGRKTLRLLLPNGVEQETRAADVPLTPIIIHSITREPAPSS